MALVVPDALEYEILFEKLSSILSLKLYGNNATPSGASSAASFNEIAGGGYASKQLTSINWSITPGDPTVAIYSAVQRWTFTGPINAPGTIYGYYVTRNSDGKLMWAERFGAGVVPFPPILGSIINVFPRFTAQSQF